MKVRLCLTDGELALGHTLESFRSRYPSANRQVSAVPDLAAEWAPGKVNDLFRRINVPRQ